MKQAQGQLDILREIATLFCRHHIPFLLSGSFAVSYWGYPRATHDIDFVLEFSRDKQAVLAQALRSLSKDYLQDVWQLQEKPFTFYSLYHSLTSTKVDLWLNGVLDFQREWGRRRETIFQRIPLAFTSAEDLILTKLSWCKEVWSDRHFRDCIGMWNVQRGNLDEEYCTKRVQKLGLGTLWENMKKGTY